MTVLTPKDAFPDQLVLAAYFQGTSLENLPESGVIGLYIIELKDRLPLSVNAFTVDEITKCQKGAGYGAEAARSSRLPIYDR